MSLPSPDPGESFDDFNAQLFGIQTPGQQVPNMNGFVGNYSEQSDNPIPPDIMHYFTPTQVPVISQLARSFAVCDQWHASAPCQTWPNRFFVHTGTANGYVNNSPTHFPYEMPTVFRQLMEEATPALADPWRVYFHDFPQALTLSSLWFHVDRFLPYMQFRQDAANGTLPSYSFIEPRYFPDLQPPNDAHPPHDVTLAEQLIADVYNIVRSSPSWKKTLLIITFDEHGGCYDHAPPPVAVPPDVPPSAPFAFDRYGVRVPAVLVSPWIARGTILRTAAAGLPHQGPPYPFDHTSIIATLRKRFAIARPLTQRDAQAPDLESVLNLTTPTNDGPASITPAAYEGTYEDLQRALQAPLNDFQRAMHEAAGHLPDLSQAATLDQRVHTIEARIAGLAQLRDQIGQGAAAAPQSPAAATPADALPFIGQKLRAMLRST